MTPGIQVKVVNSHWATSEYVPVNLDRRVDFPTEGNPTKPILASPFLATSNPSPPPPPFLEIASNCSLFSLAIFAFRSPMCPSVALFFYVLKISASIRAIFS